MMNSKERFTEAEIVAIPSPEYTKSWNPISHGEVIQSVQAVIDEKGVGVVNKSYSTTNNGRNMFGSWTLDLMHGETSRVQIGFRNSIMKKFAVGMCGGDHVIVCSNLMFSGEFVEFRKHTSGLDFEELIAVAGRAFDKVLVDSERTHAWHESLKEVPLPQADFKALTYDAMAAGIIPPNRFKNFIASVEQEQEIYRDLTLYQFHGGVTRLVRDNNLFTVSDRTRDLKLICDEYTTLKAA
jgi:hypothetical protein